MPEMSVDGFSQSLATSQPIYDSQDTIVPETQPLSITYPQHAKILSATTTLPSQSEMVQQIVAKAAAMLAKKCATKATKAYSTGHEKASKTIKWEPFLSIFVLKWMCELIKSGVRHEKRFKEVHLNSVACKMFDFCGIEVSAQQVYNHLRKWRSRWIKVSKLRNLSGV